MLICIPSVVTKAEIDEFRAVLSAASFVDGSASAGWSARLVKDNAQAQETVAIAGLRTRVLERLADNAVFALAVRPKRILGPAFSRYRPGQAYGSHVDDAIMDGNRTDVSFTLFLTPPAEYDGGDLIIESSAGEDAIKLDAGSLVAYPSTALHRVAPVTRGERLAAVGWVRSLVRDPARRELLFDLETARRKLFDQHGKTAEFDLLAKCAANLTRMWCDD